MATDQIKYNPVFHGVVAELQPFQDIEEMTEINLWDRQEQLGLVDEMGLKLLNYFIRTAVRQGGYWVKKSRKAWQGAAAILMHDKQMLMIKTKKSQSWSIPSGGIEDGETPQQACIREVWEETGFRVQIIRPLHVKKAVIENYDVTTHYFLCQVVEGEIRYHDPDDEIEEIAWKTKPELKSLAHDFPEDLETLLSFFDRRSLEV